MKPYFVIMIAAMFLALPACEQKQTATEKVMDRVDDALDRRPQEDAQDLAEDMSDKVEDALDRRSGEKARDVAEDVSDELQDAAKEIEEKVKAATK